MATGSMSDPYNPLEEKQRLTRGMLTLLLRYSFGVSIATKSSLVERDIDLLEQIKGYAPALVKLTITTPHDRLAEQLEPHAPSSSRRLQTLERLRARGIFCRRAADAGPSLFGGTTEGRYLSAGRAVCAGRSKIYLPLFWSDPAGPAAGIFFGVPGKKPDQMFGKNNLVLGEGSMTTAARMKRELWQVSCEECKSTASCGGWSRSSQLLKSRIKTNSFAFFR